MSNELNNLFNNNQEAAAGSRSLAGTAQLTTLSMALANEILKTIEGDFAEYKELVARSKQEHKAMDDLIAKAFDLTIVDVEFIRLLDDSVVELMLKSQQSKRSRSKSKTMTMDNYRSMMIGAIAENLIRLATGKVKSAGGARRTSGSVEFTAEQLEELTNDQERLRKEIRNVQSKKSIFKAKEDFSEEAEYWQQLLVAEEALKSVRTVATKTITVDETKDALADILGDADVTTMKAGDAKKLLERIAALTASQEA